MEGRDDIERLANQPIDITCYQVELRSALAERSEESRAKRGPSPRMWHAM